MVPIDFGSAVTGLGDRSSANGSEPVSGPDRGPGVAIARAPMSAANSKRAGEFDGDEVVGVTASPPRPATCGFGPVRSGSLRKP